MVRIFARLFTDLRFVKKNYKTGFSGPKFYTVKEHKLQLFLLTKKQVNALITVILVIFGQNFTECLKFQQFQCKITIGVCKSWSSMQIMQEFVLFSGKNYTVGTHFTQPPVVMVAINLNSGYTQIRDRGGHNVPSPGPNRVDFNDVPLVSKDGP